MPVESGAASPAWVISGNRLIVAGSLDALKTQLAQEAGSQSLADVSAVASRLKTGAVMVTYQDTKVMVGQLLAMMQAFGPFGTTMLAQQGIKVDMPTVPELKSIAPHILPRTSTLRVMKHSLVSEAYETVPLVGRTLSLAPVAGLGDYLTRARDSGTSEAKRAQARRRRASVARFDASHGVPRPTPAIIGRRWLACSFPACGRDFPKHIRKR